LNLRLLAVLLAAASIAPAQQPQFSFAVFADIQYGDQPDSGKREYRRSLAKLREAVGTLNQRRDLAFAIQLGDLIDSRAVDLDTILPVWQSLSTRTYNVAGNHDFVAPRRYGYYEFTRPGWRFLVLDGMDVSVASPEGSSMLQRLKTAGAANAQEWNGGIGATQLAWLRDRLAKAKAAHQRVIAFCHFPVFTESSTPAHLLWNHETVLQVLEASPAVAAWFNGHDHNGGYALHNEVHFVTFPGLVESGPSPSYTIVRVFKDRLELQGAGGAPARTLRLR
jgi:manganese-dependent ADP-ribose/CDP-alcohol diphosphatase